MIVVSDTSPLNYLVLIQYDGTLGVLKIAAEKGLICLPDALAALRQTSFRVSEFLLDEALARDAERAQVRKQRSK